MKMSRPRPRTRSRSRARSRARNGDGTSPRRRFLTVAVAIGSPLALAALVAAAVAIPSGSIWNTGDRDRPGQLSIFNGEQNAGAFGMPLAAGDFDGDGRPDLAVASIAATSGPANDHRINGGEVHVYRGEGTISGTIDRATFGEEGPFPGLTIHGARLDDLLGIEVFACDVNGDGIDDLIVGAQHYDGPVDDRPTAGGVFVFLGRPGLLEDGSVIDLLAVHGLQPPVPGLTTVIGERAGDRLGIWVEGGDLDGDGLCDLLLGADQSPGASGAGSEVGMVAVIAGRESFPQLIDLATAPDTLEGLTVIYGEDDGDHFGSTIHARDLDRDGRDELVVAAAMNRRSAEQPDRSGGGFPAVGIGGGDGPDETRFDCGQTYVFFSDRDGAPLPARLDLGAGLPAEIAARLGVIHGPQVTWTVGEELGSADIDGDGFPELVLGALSAVSPDLKGLAGAAFVVYGAHRLRGQTLDLDTETATPPPGISFSTMFGTKRLHILGDTVTAGDFNNDGIEDLVVGVPVASSSRIQNDDPGTAIVVFGRRSQLKEVFFPTEPGSDPYLVYVNGADQKDKLSYSMEAIDFDGDGHDDLFTNAMHGDGSQNTIIQAGEAYLVSGYHLSGRRLEVTSVSPSRLAVRRPARITVRGCGFTTGADTRVLVDGVEASDVVVRTGLELTAMAPAVPAPRVVSVTVTTRYDTVTLENALELVEESRFVRGDTTGDGALSIADAIETLNFIFRRQPATCLDAHDTDDDGQLTIADPVRTLIHLFRGAPPPPEPFPDEGIDPTGDGLSCI